MQDHRAQTLENVIEMRGLKRVLIQAVYPGADGIGADVTVTELGDDMQLCPQCSMEMIMAQATNFGEKYPYCRACKKELAEMGVNSSLAPGVKIMKPQSLADTGLSNAAVNAAIGAAMGIPVSHAGVPGPYHATSPQPTYTEDVAGIEKCRSIAGTPTHFWHGSFAAPHCQCRQYLAPGQMSKAFGGTTHGRATASQPNAQNLPRQLAAHPALGAPYRGTLQVPPASAVPSYAQPVACAFQIGEWVACDVSSLANQLIVGQIYKITNILRALGGLGVEVEGITGLICALYFAKTTAKHASGIIIPGDLVRSLKNSGGLTHGRSYQVIRIFDHSPLVMGYNRSGYVVVNDGHGRRCHLLPDEFEVPGIYP